MQVAQLAACGVVVVEDMTDVMSSALIAAHRSTLAATDDDLAEAERMLMAIRPHVRVINADEFDDEVAEGRACVVLGYSGDLARARAVAAESGRIVEYVIPSEGAVRWVDVMAIPANAPHPRNAHKLINHLLKPEVIAKISNALRYANTNVESTAMLDESLRADRSVFPDASVAARLVDAPVLPNERRAQWRAIWDRFTAKPAKAEPAATTTRSE
ncbi:MAG: extracellular solute-binding protein [Ahniella sp.]|nr:extracellular solute-binding protein [Ahniella sp.]